MILALEFNKTSKKIWKFLVRGLRFLYKRNLQHDVSKIVFTYDVSTYISIVSLNRSPCVQFSCIKNIYLIFSHNHCLNSRMWLNIVFEFHQRREHLKFLKLNMQLHSLECCQYLLLLSPLINERYQAVSEPFQTEFVYQIHLHQHLKYINLTLKMVLKCVFSYQQKIIGK